MSAPTHGRLQGRVALITGANRHIGGTIGAFMAAEGARVACNDVVPAVAEETAAHIRARGGEALAVPGDIADEAAVAATVEQAAAALGCVDILVNNAGIQSKADVLSVELADWVRQLNIFLTGTMLLTRAVARALVAQGRPGSIINILSTSAHQGRPGTIAYCTCKGGQLNFTRAAAMDLAPYGIRVNAITPTAMEHSVVPPVPDAPAAAPAAARSPITAEDFLRGIPLGRLPRSTDIAQAAVFLASDEASMITGHDLHVDGGALARYWAWTPAASANLTVEEYRRTRARNLAWGEDVGA